MRLFPSVAVSVEEVEDVFLVKVESVRTTWDVDPDGAILNTPGSVSSKNICWSFSYGIL